MVSTPASLPRTHSLFCNGVLSRLLSFDKDKYYNAQWLFGGCLPFQIGGWIQDYQPTRMATATFLLKQPK